MGRKRAKRRATSARGFEERLGRACQFPRPPRTQGKPVHRREAGEEQLESEKWGSRRTKQRPAGRVAYLDEPVRVSRLVVLCRFRTLWCHRWEREEGRESKSKQDKEKEKCLEYKLEMAKWSRSSHRSLLFPTAPVLLE